MMAALSAKVFGFTVALIFTGQLARTQRCPNDWVNFGDSCYAFIDEYVPWTSAKVICQTFEAKMVEIESQAENDFIVGQIRARDYVEAVWLGLQDFIREGRWVWNSNNEEATYFNWEPGEPNDSHGYRQSGQDCVHLRASSGQWDDGWCEVPEQPRHNNSVACEKDANEEEVIG